MANLLLVGRLVTDEETGKFVIPSCFAMLAIRPAMRSTWLGQPFCSLGEANRLNRWAKTRSFKWNRMELPELDQARATCVGDNRLLIWMQDDTENVTASCLVDAHQHKLLNNICGLAECNSPPVSEQWDDQCQCENIHAEFGYKTEGDCYNAFHRFVENSPDEAGTQNIVGELRVRHHPNTQVLAMDSRYALLPCERSGEDACYEGMRLYDYRKNELLTTVPFEVADPNFKDAANDCANATATTTSTNDSFANISGQGPPFIEVEWARGLVFGTSQIFYILESDFYFTGSGSVLYTCHPQD
jgi:hypothetical protein